MLREYQLEAVAAVEGAWTAGMRRPAAVLATGLGKTVIFSELARRGARATRRPVVLVHRDELVRQTVAKLHAADPHLRVGIVQGPNMGLARTEVVVASVQTLIRRLGDIAGSRFDFLIVDEAHHAAADSYKAILEHFGAFDSGAIALGMTATMSRGDNRGLGDIWEDVVFERDIRFGVANGFLVPAEVRTVRLAMNTDRLSHGVDGDIAAGALARAMSAAGAGPLIAQAYSEFGRDAYGDLRRAISFAPTVDVAQAWTEEYRAIGARAAVITGKTPTEERQGVYRALAAGALDVISSVGVLTEGFDLPAVEVAIIGRPTESMGLLTQMVGRVLRPSPDTGKTCALVIDVVGALGCGLARTVDLSIPGPPEPVAPVEREDRPPMPAPEIAPPAEVEFVGMTLDGTPIGPARRLKGHARAPWLRTYGGVPFLPPTREFDCYLFVAVVERGGERLGPWWRWPKTGEPEPLELAADADLRDLHPGIRRSPYRATDRQVELLRRLRGAGGAPLLAPDTERPSATEAGELLDVHFASRVLDPFVAARTALPLVRAS